MFLFSHHLGFHERLEELKALKVKSVNTSYIRENNEGSFQEPLLSMSFDSEGRLVEEYEHQISDGHPRSIKALYTYNIADGKIIVIRTMLIEESQKDKFHSIPCHQKEEHWHNTKGQIIKTIRTTSFDKDFVTGEQEQWLYDYQEALLKEEHFSKSGSKSYSIFYQYDDTGKLISKSQHFFNPTFVSEVVYYYKGSLLIKEVNNGPHSITSYHCKYDQFGRIIEKEKINGESSQWEESYKYDNNGKLKEDNVFIYEYYNNGLLHLKATKDFSDQHIIHYEFWS
jgi:hypothetical protein